MIVLDIETSPILPHSPLSFIDELYCIAIKEPFCEVKCYTKDGKHSANGSFKEAIEVIQRSRGIIGHNIIKFDLPVLTHKLNIDFKDKVIVDTLIDSQLTFAKDELYAFSSNLEPKYMQSYSLKAFGMRMGLYKSEFDSFDKLSDEMIEYCKQDVRVTYALYQLLKSLPTYPARHIRECEYEVARIIQLQEDYGFYFDIDSARKFSLKMQFEMMNLTHKLQRKFPPIFVPDKDVIEPKKARTYKSYVKTFYNTLKPFKSILELYKKPKKIVDPITGLITYQKYKTYKEKFFSSPHKIITTLVDGPYQNIKLQKFNPNSRQQCVTRLKSLDWIPTFYTFKGNPQLNEDVLRESLKEYDD